MFFKKYSFTIQLSSGTEFNMQRYAKSRKDLYNYYAKQQYYYHLGHKQKVVAIKNIEADKETLPPQESIQINSQPVTITKKLIESLSY